MSQHSSNSSSDRTGVRRRKAAQKSIQSSRAATEQQYASGVWYRSDSPDEQNAQKSVAGTQSDETANHFRHDPFEIMLPEVPSPLADLPTEPVSAEAWQPDESGTGQIEPQQNVSKPEIPSLNSEQEISPVLGSMNEASPLQSDPLQEDLLDSGATDPTNQSSDKAEEPTTYLELPQEWNHLLFTTLEVSSRIQGDLEKSAGFAANEAKTVKADSRNVELEETPSFSEAIPAEQAASWHADRKPKIEGGIELGIESFDSSAHSEGQRTELLTNAELRSGIPAKPFDSIESDKAVTNPKQNSEANSAGQQVETASTPYLQGEEIPVVFDLPPESMGGEPISVEQDVIVDPIAVPDSGENALGTQASKVDKIEAAMQARQQKYRLDQPVLGGLPKSRLPKSVFRVLSELSVSDLQDDSAKEIESKSERDGEQSGDSGQLPTPIADPATESLANEVAESAELEKARSEEVAAVSTSSSELPAIEDSASGELAQTESTESRDAILINPDDQAEALGVISGAQIGASAALLPAWEVDFFRWPDVTNRLLREEYQSFDTVLESLQIGRSVQGQIVFVTGVDREEGRSTISVCLARRAAGLGLSTLLVDGDLQQPSLDQQAGLEFTNGWLHQGARPELVEEALVRCMLSDLKLMPQGVLPQSDDEPDKLRYQRLWEMLNVARPHFDVLIVDAGLTGAFVPYVDSEHTQIHNALLVQGPAVDNRDRLANAYHQLLAVGVESVAVAATFGRQREAG